MGQRREGIVKEDGVLCNEVELDGYAGLRVGWCMLTYGGVGLSSYRVGFGSVRQGCVGYGRLGLSSIEYWSTRQDSVEHRVSGQG